MSLKEEIADLFIEREQLQARTQYVNQQLQLKVTQLQKESRDGEGADS